MDMDRSVAITIGGEDYRLILTTKATMEIGSRYGGLENLSDNLLKPENLEPALDEFAWLITMLANQGVMIHNLQNKDDKKELLSAEYVATLTTPFELSTYRDAILETLLKGVKRYVESEEPKTKNQQAG